MKVAPLTMTPSVQFGIIVFLVTLLVGCSASQPSVGDAEQAVLARIKSESQGRIKLVSFQKTNGQSQKQMGVEMYCLEYAAVIEFTEDCKWVKHVEDLHRGFKTVRALPPKADVFEKLMDDSLNPGVLVKKGQIEKLSASITFEKTEKGWRVMQEGR